MRGVLSTRCRVGAPAWLAVAACASSVPVPAPAQVGGGRVIERVRSTTDTSQAYDLYLPPGYGDARLRPVLFVLDPRGRARLGLELFAEAAGRLGWIVMSSYNTLSDGPAEPNVDAMNAMLASAQARLAIDPSRLYLAGFSGTARVALRFAVALRGHIAGVIAAGGAVGFELGGPETAFAGDSTFAYFGAAGTGDFNHDEVFALAERFGRLRVPYRVVVFEGPHSWPPAAVCGAALEWLELRAMTGGLRTTDSAWVRERLAADLAQAAELDSLGRREEALRLYDAITRDYAGWPGSGGAAARASVLRGDAAVIRYEREAHALADRDQRQGVELLKTLEWERAQRDPPPLESLMHRLHVAELQRTAERGDSLQAASARRVLARIHVWLAFYEPRAYLANGAPARAARMFEAAVAIGPIQGEGCALLRQALVAATAEQRERLAGQCAPETKERG